MIEVDQLGPGGEQLREAFGCFPSGVAAVCAMVGAGPVGMAVSSFTPVSLAPPLVSVCVQHTSTTWPQLRAAARFGARLGLSVLAEGHDAVCRALARKGVDRFAEVDWTTGLRGSVFVHGSSAWFDCSIQEEILAGDHTMVLLRIHRLQCEHDVAPLVFHSSRFRRLATS
jgi:flavin reductase (DIM6/NTAB) family NADH-FMN oxidoreductase RutF